MNLVSILIINYNSASLLMECLDSLYRFNTAREIEVIIVDNHSSEDIAPVQMKFPQVRIHRMSYNAGFSRANNAAMKLARGNAFLLLNPDTLAIDDAVTKCFHRLMHSPYSAAGVQLLNADHTSQISGNYFVRGGVNHLLPIPYWGRVIRFLGMTTGARTPHVKQSADIEEVDWISGAFLMVKREAVEKAGMMDEDFFLYAEEIEWCSRLRKTGPLCIFGDLHMVHLEGGSINKAQNLQDRGYYNVIGRKGLQLMVSNHLRVRKQYGVGWFLFLLLNYTWGVPFFAVCSSLSQVVRLRNPFAAWKRVGAYAANVGKLWLLAPRIIRNRPYFYKMM